MLIGIDWGGTKIEGIALTEEGQEIVRLRHQLGMEVVCTHHTPDDVMWTDALDAGALDCCFDDDGPAICRAIQQTSTACNRAAS